VQKLTVFTNENLNLQLSVGSAIGSSNGIEKSAVSWSSILSQES
jgi:hypothetical protein